MPYKPDDRAMLPSAASSAPLCPTTLSEYITLDVRDNILVERWKVLRRHLGKLILFGLLGAIVGFSLSFLQKPAYQASALLEIQEVNEDFLNLKSITPIAQESAAISIDEIQTYIRRLQSRTLLASVVEKLGLTQVPQPAGLLHRLRQFVGLSTPPIDPLERSIDLAAANLQVREVGRSRMVEITFTSDSASGAAGFANGLANELLQQNLQSRGTLTQNVSEWINQQLSETRRNLEHSEEALEDYTRHTGLLYLAGPSGPTNTDASATISTEKLRQVQEELSRAEADRMNKESQYRLAKTASPEALPFLSGDLAVRTQQDKLTDLRRQKAELGTNYTPRYGTMKSIEAQIQVLQDALAKERSNILKQIENDYLAALGREKLLLTQYQDQSKLVNDEGVKAVQYQMLKREVESNRQLYDDMLQRTKQASVAAALRANNIRFVDPARVPLVPYKPNPPINAALGIIGGLFVGAVWFTGFNGQDRITQPGELKSISGISELGAVQSAKTSKRQFTKKRAVLTRNSLVFSAPTAYDEDLLLSRLALLTPDLEPSATAQCYRSILTSLRLSDRSRECRVIALTSPGAMEGKTTVATGLGVVLARMQQRVLIVDGDFYKPDLHRRLDAHNEKGFADVLRLSEGSGLNIEDYIQQTGIRNLSILASGGGSPAPMLFSSRLREIFRELREAYDFVLVDTPPILQIADARVLGKLSDCVILVTRAGVTKRDAALLAVERLRDDGVPVLGSVLNDWNPSSVDSTYYPTYRRNVPATRGQSDSTRPEVNTL